MDEETLRIKYPTDHGPTDVYSDETGAVNVAIHHTQDKMPQRHLVTFHKHIDEAYRKAQPSATWLFSGIINVDGRNWFKLVLRTPALDTEIHNTVLGTSLDDRLLLVSLNVTKELEEAWLQPYEAIIQSLRIAD